MTNEQKIENGVCYFYKVEAEDLYSCSKSKYPYGIARKNLQYLLYEGGVKVYDIAKLFGISERLVFRNCAEINVALKSDTKIKEDVEAIKNIIKQF